MRVLLVGLPLYILSGFLLNEAARFVLFIHWRSVDCAANEMRAVWILSVQRCQAAFKKSRFLKPLPFIMRELAPLAFKSTRNNSWMNLGSTSIATSRHRTQFFLHDATSSLFAGGFLPSPEHCGNKRAPVHLVLQYKHCVAFLHFWLYTQSDGKSLSDLFPVCWFWEMLCAKTCWNWLSPVHVSTQSQISWWNMSGSPHVVKLLPHTQVWTEELHFWPHGGEIHDLRTFCLNCWPPVFGRG